MYKYFKIGNFVLILDSFTNNFKGYENFLRFHNGALKLRDKFYFSYSFTVFLNTKKIINSLTEQGGSII